jgi:Tfp pilus assembly protein PilE
MHDRAMPITVAVIAVIAVVAATSVALALTRVAVARRRAARAEELADVAASWDQWFDWLSETAPARQDSTSETHGQHAA